MPLIKTTIFQKNLTEGLNANILRKLITLKSDFLVFPEFFNADSNIKSIENLKDKSKIALDWLLKLNQSYKGIIIGGSILLEEEGNYYIVSPILFNGELVDTYKKRNLSNEEKQFLKEGKDPGIFILNNIRFAVLISNDVYNDIYLEELKEQNIKLIFIVNHTLQNNLQENQVQENFFLDISRKYSFTIVKCDGVGTLFDKKLIGKSLVCSPKGITWRTSTIDEENQVIRDVMISL